MYNLRNKVLHALSRFTNKKSKSRYENNSATRVEVDLPLSFLECFDSEDYLLANPDVRKSIKKGHHQSALDHFRVAGYQEVMQGGRRIGSKFPHFDRDVYLKYNPDLSELTSRNGAFEHFVRHGYCEYLNGDRIIIGYFPLPNNPESVSRIKAAFDENAYLYANTDISAAIARGEIKSGWDHFVKFGIREAQCTGRPLNVIVGSMTEPEYLFKFPDLFKRMMQGVIDSPFQHFLEHGLQEIVSGRRVVQAYGGYQYYEPDITEDVIAIMGCFAQRPLISVVIPVFNVEKRWLELAVSSIKKQWYSNWEICIADDCSTNTETIGYLNSIVCDQIKVKFLTKNINISGASNEAFKLAQGDYIALMDNDDELTPDALYEVVKEINKGAEFIYSDEDKLELNGQFTEPHFKPDFSPDMLLSHNYISHLGVIKRSIVKEVEGWTVGLEGAQDYDLYLKVLERTKKISHIPKVLYHWRKVPGSTAAAFNDKSYAQQAGRKALSNALRRRGIGGQVKYGVSPGLYRIKYKIKDEPLVSIVIPFKDKPELLSVCITSLLKKTNYKNFEVIGVSNNSEEASTFTEMQRLSSLDSRVRFIEFNVPFNYSKINNHAVRSLAKGDYVVFMNNDIEVISEHWIEEMLMLAQRENTGCVGAKLLYADSTIQHAGIVIAPGTRHLVIPVFSRFPRNSLGYSARLATVNNYSAVTAALMMISRKKFDEVGGFDEINFAVAYNDVDLCLKVKRGGYYNVYTPYAEAFHYESMSRGYDTESVTKLERLGTEAHKLKTLNQDFSNDYDENYNPNLNVDDVSFQISPTIGRLNEAYIGKPFSEKIVKKGELRKKQKNRVCLFSHFDHDDIIDDYVVYYIKELSRLYDVVFISTSSGMSSKEISKIEAVCLGYIIKENTGYDFGAWKSGLNYISKLVDDYDYLLMCNDSVYGPFTGLEKIVAAMELSDIDVWSMSDNNEYHYHLQSFFVQYSKAALNHKIFNECWDNFKIFDDKKTLINKYEVGFFNNVVKNSGLKINVLYSTENKTFLNPLHYHWKEMLMSGFPFLKIELLKKNPMSIDISDYKDVIQKTGGNYPLSLMESHLSRVK